LKKKDLSNDYTNHLL